MRLYAIKAFRLQKKWMWYCRSQMHTVLAVQFVASMR